MNGPGNTTQTEGRARGALIASFLRVVLAASAVVGTGALPGCLLGGPFAPDDAEFRPLRPPVILENEETIPRPNRFVPVPMSESITFRVCIAYGSRAPLVGRVFVDRALTCANGVNCGLAQPQREIPFVDSGACRVFSFDVSFEALRARRCLPVDLYVSSEFSREFNPETLHLPDRVGDVAHARWYVVRADAPAGVPTIDQCCANYGDPDPLRVERCY